MTNITTNANRRRSGPMEHTAALRRLLARFPLPVIELMMRAGVGALFFKSGLTKIASWDSTIALFENEYMPCRCCRPSWLPRWPRRASWPARSS